MRRSGLSFASLGLAAERLADPADAGRVEASVSSPRSGEFAGGRPRGAVGRGVAYRAALGFALCVGCADAARGQPAASAVPLPAGGRLAAEVLLATPSAATFTAPSGWSTRRALPAPAPRTAWAVRQTPLAKEWI